MEITPNYSHITELEVDLGAMSRNIDLLNSLMVGQTEMMPVIKADAYGSGVIPVAKKLQEKGIKYLAVAIIEEGIQLRKAGIDIQILVLYPDLITIEAAWVFNFELEVYSDFMLDHVIQISERRKEIIPIHLMIDTGMHRLGFLPHEIDSVLDKIKNSNYIKLVGIMSHLSSSEDPIDDKYTEQQYDLFDGLYENIVASIGYRPNRHIQNTGGIIRHPDRGYEISRLGIGLYGIDPSKSLSDKLEKVHTFTARIIQIKDLKKGDSVSYNRKTILDKDTRIAVVNVGYADGLIRSAGNRKYQVGVGNESADIIGNVTMDSIMIDLTNCPDAKEYDKVEIFGRFIPIENLAVVGNTIPYEVLCDISTRVKRIYIDER